MNTIITTLMNPEPASHHHGNIRFPLLLYSVLQDAEKDPDLADIISWEPSGTSFKIHDQKSCAENVLPHYFPKMKSYRSLRRQLNLYGIRIHNNPNEKFSQHVLANKMVASDDCTYSIALQNLYARVMWEGPGCYHVPHTLPDP
jgi:hypothetical protein